MTAQAEIAVIGGSGLYSLFSAPVTEVKVDTPYGSPSGQVTVARVGKRSVAFLPRHGRDHRFPPHRIPYRANMWALRKLGVRHIFAPCAVGGLRAALGPGTLVVPDQIVDRTVSRLGTFWDSGARHTSFADPYCPVGRRTVLDVAAKMSAAESTDRGISGAVDGGTMVVIEGPRFSTRAESQWYAAQGGSVINMTGMPEAILARELGMCYTSIALVTDTDAGVEVGESVTHEEVMRVFAENIERVRAVLLQAVSELPLDHACVDQTKVDVPPVEGTSTV
ncbi:MAG: S-methyl-5'-thioadenosine phosphorylase [Longispora sp.]|nr:S-methyl-5'-thioadenosine phosphorylase [Longispora sp. (in: high G+C Gram-positive bacteria)]